MIRTCDLDQTTLLCQGPLYIAEGAVLDRTEENLADGSHFYAVFYNTATGRIDTHLDWSTSSGVCHAGVWVDADEHHTEAARDYMFTRLQELCAARDAHPREGVRARSLTTKGKAKGLEGMITRKMVKRSFDRTGLETVFLIEHGRTSAWVPQNRVQVLDVPSSESLAEEAQMTVAGRSARELARMFVDTERLLKRYRRA